MMRTKTPALFYLFRKAVGVFCFMFFCNSYVGQTESKPEAIKDPKSEGASIYIWEGTYVHNFSQLKNPKKKKETKTTNRPLSVKKRKKTKRNTQILKKEEEKPFVKYRYSSTKTNQALLSSYIQKKSFTGCQQDYSNKFFENSAISNSINTYRVLRPQVIIKSFKEYIQFFFDDFKVRPPPTFVAI